MNREENCRVRSYIGCVPELPVPLRIALIDDHEMVLRGLEAMLSHFTEDVTIVGSVTTQAEAHRLVAVENPDILLSDVRIGRGSGIDLAAELARTAPSVKVVMLTAYDDEHYLFQALKAGARGYLLKRIDGHELVNHLRRIAEGDVVIDPSLSGKVAMSAARLASGEYWPGANIGLTQRESEVFALLVAGHTNKAIASRLVISEETVKTHVRGLYRKIDAQDRAGAIAYALRERLFL